MISDAMDALQFAADALMQNEAGHRRLEKISTRMKLMLFAIVMCLVIALFALGWFHLVNSDAGESTQKRAVGGRGGPKRRPRSKSADGDDVEATQSHEDAIDATLMFRKGEAAASRDTADARTRTPSCHK